MGTFLAYMIYSGAILLGLYIVYKWALAPENQSRFNRVVLWLIYILAFSALPLTAWVVGIFHVADIAPSTSDIFITLPVTEFNGQLNEKSSNFYGAIILIYFIGMSLMLSRSVVMHIRILKIISSGEKCGCVNGYNLVVIDDNTIAPFSWMRYIVMNRSDFESAGNIIAKHEQQHLSMWHWIDLLMSEIVLIIQWFNPASWLLREEFKAVHEYQADKGVLNSGVKAKDYQLLLISKAVGLKVGSLANSLNHGKMKKRLSMMMNPTTRKSSRFKALLILPVAILFVSAAESPYSQQFLGDISNVSFDDEDIEIVADQTVMVDDNKMGNAALDSIVVVEVGSYPKSEAGIADNLNRFGLKGSVAGIKDSTKKVETYESSFKIKGISIRSTDKIDDEPTVYIDGVECTKEQYASLDPSMISSISVLKNKPEHPNGVIEIHLKK